MLRKGYVFPISIYLNVQVMGRPDLLHYSQKCVEVLLLLILQIANSFRYNMKPHKNSIKIAKSFYFYRFISYSKQTYINM